MIKNYLTDGEKSLLYAALRREKQFCKILDYGAPLVRDIETLENMLYYDRLVKQIENEAYTKAINDFMATLYHEAFETDTDLQKWDNGYWIRYKMCKSVAEELKKKGVK